MQQMTSDINKMKRLLSSMLLLSTGGAYTSCRGPVAGSLQAVALPSRSVEKLHHRMPNLSRWNRYMVLPRKHLCRVEREGVTFVDLWKTYVLHRCLFMILILSGASRSGFWKEYFAVGYVSPPSFMVINSPLLAPRSYERSGAGARPD